MSINSMSIHLSMTNSSNINMKIQWSALKNHIKVCMLFKILSCCQPVTTSNLRYKKREKHYRVKCLLFQSPLREFSWGLTFWLFLCFNSWQNSFFCPLCEPFLISFVQLFFHFPELPAFPWEFLNSILHDFCIAILVILTAAFLAAHGIHDKDLCSLALFMLVSPVDQFKGCCSSWQLLKIHNYIKGWVRYSPSYNTVKPHLEFVQLLLFNYKSVGSCVLKVSAVECRSILLIDTLNQDLDQYLIDIPIDTRSTHYQHLINSRSIVCECQPTHINRSKISRLLTDTRPRWRWSVDQVSTEVSMECRLSIDQGYWSTLDCGCL